MYDCQDPKTTNLYFILGSDLDLELKTLYHYLSTLSFLIWLTSLSINLQLTSSSLLLCILDHYTSANIKLLNTAVSLLGTVFILFYLLWYLLFLVFKSCTCNVLVQFWYQLCFITSCLLPEISLSHSYSSSTPPVLKLGQQKGWTAQHICWG